MLQAYISSVFWMVELLSMEDAEVEATPCSSLVFLCVRACRTRLRYVYFFLFLVG
jgi:hypothetical protein